MNSFVTTLMEMVRRLILGARQRVPDSDAGMSTAEYAVGTVAAVAFAVVLYKVVRSDAVSSAVADRALGSSCHLTPPAVTAAW